MRLNVQKPRSVDMVLTVFTTFMFVAAIFTIPKLNIGLLSGAFVSDWIRF